MGQKFFGVDLQAEMGAAIPPGSMPSFTLTKTITDPTSTDDSSTSTSGPYTCHGSISDYSFEDMKDDPLIQRGDKKISIIGLPLAQQGVEPADGDTLTDEDGKTYTIVNAHTTSFKASWIIQCRG